MSPHLVDMDSENKLIMALRESVDALGIPPTSVAPYILAISGGKDSMALMHIFAQVYGPSSGRIVTIDHGIRPESAQEVIYVEREARMLGYEVDIVSLALSSDTPSLEAHARDLRYTALDTYRSKYHASHIITAHHRWDQLETVVMRLLSWSSIVGLSGMEIVSQFIFRPWLSVDPSVISDYVESRKIVYFEDPSNKDTNFRRNQIRHDIIPSLLLSTPHFGETILTLSEHAREVSEWMQRSSRDFLDRYPPFWFDARDFAELATAHRYEIIATLYQMSHGWSRQGLSRGLIQELDRYISTASGATHKVVWSLHLSKSRHIISYAPQKN